MPETRERAALIQRVVDLGCEGEHDHGETCADVLRQRPQWCTPCLADAVLRATPASDHVVDANKMVGPTPASDGGEVRERAMGFLRQYDAGGGVALTLDNAAGIVRALLSGTPQVEGEALDADEVDAVIEGLLIRHACYEIPLEEAKRGIYDALRSAPTDDADRRAATAFRRLAGMMAKVYGEEGLDLAPEFVGRVMSYAMGIMLGLDEWTRPESGDWTAEEEEIIGIGLRSAPTGEGEACSHLFDVAKCIYCGAPSPRAAAPVPAREGEEDEVEEALGRVLYSLQPEFRHTRKRAVEHANEVLNRRTMQRAARLRSEGGGE